MASFPTPPTDPKLVSTTDMGAFTGDENGSLGEKLQNIRDNLAPAATIATLAPAGVEDATNGLHRVGISRPYYFNKFVLLPTGSPYFTPGGANINGGAAALSFDGAYNELTYQHITGTATSGSLFGGSQFFMHPYGLGGRPPMDMSITEPWSAWDTMVFEFCGELDANATATNRGIGPTTGSFSTGDFVKIGRDSNGWFLESRDNSTTSLTNEASDSSDGNRHVFRLECGVTEVRLYVDNILKVTKTTNLPRWSTNPPSSILLQVPAADATGAFKISSWAVYWKVA